MSAYDTQDTICALSTPSGRGAIGVIRLSGDQALDICNKVFVGKDLTKEKANTLHFGKIQRDSEVIDEVVVALFKNPKSYTGEDVIEISCHGSPFVQSEVIKVLLDNGARLAKEGEFTFRAFINGKLNLSQAEAVADLIASDSKASKDLAISQLRGGYSKRLKELRNRLMDFASLLELELDFSEEDVDFANKGELLDLINELSGVIKQLLNSFEQGNVLKNGLPIAIIGEPNVGKSTLLNSILQEERAIVSDIPGTTRDYIEDEISIDGVMFRFIDTAGLRETVDEVEAKGIERAREKAQSARLVIHMIDAQNFNEKIQSEINKSDDRSLIVLNKCDVLSESTIEQVRVSYPEVVFVSAKQGTGIEELMNKLLEKVNLNSSEGNGVVLSNARHMESLKKSAEALDRCLLGLNEGSSSELIAMDVRQALHHIGEITGEVSNDDILGNIFSKFCIGK